MFGNGMHVVVLIGITHHGNKWYVKALTGFNGHTIY